MDDATRLNRLHQLVGRLRTHMKAARRIAYDADQAINALKLEQRDQMVETLRFQRKRFLDSTNLWAHELNDALTVMLCRLELRGKANRRERGGARLSCRARR
jgi:hypothetical protein